MALSRSWWTQSILGLKFPEAPARQSNGPNGRLPRLFISQTVLRRVIVRRLRRPHHLQGIESQGHLARSNLHQHFHPRPRHSHFLRPFRSQTVLRRAIVQQLRRPPRLQDVESQGHLACSSLHQHFHPPRKEVMPKQLPAGVHHLEALLAMLISPLTSLLLKLRRCSEALTIRHG